MNIEPKVNDHAPRKKPYAQKIQSVMNGDWFKADCI